MADIQTPDDWTPEELAHLSQLKSYCAHVLVHIERAACRLQDPSNPEPVLQILKQGARYIVESFNGNYLSSGDFNLIISQSASALELYRQERAPV